MYNSREKVINLPVNNHVSSQSPWYFKRSKHANVHLANSDSWLSTMRSCAYPQTSVSSWGMLGNFAAEKGLAYTENQDPPKPGISDKKRVPTWMIFGNITIFGNHHICNAKSYAANYLHTHFTLLMGPKSVPKQCKVYIYICMICILYIQKVRD